MGNRQPKNTPAKEEVSTSENRDYICSNRKNNPVVVLFSENTIFVGRRQLPTKIGNDAKYV